MRHEHIDYTTALFRGHSFILLFMWLGIALIFRHSILYFQNFDFEFLVRGCRLASLIILCGLGWDSRWCCSLACVMRLFLARILASWGWTQRHFDSRKSQVLTRAAGLALILQQLFDLLIVPLYFFAWASLFGFPLGPEDRPSLRGREVLAWTSHPH